MKGPGSIFLWCAFLALASLACTAEEEPPSPEAVKESMLRGKKALLSRQHDDGSWGGDEVKNQDSHKSDYPVAISSLAYLALLSTAAEGAEAAKAREKSLRFIFDIINPDGTMKNTRDNTPKIHERNVWSQAFSMFVFSRILAAKDVPDETKSQLRTETKNMIAALKKTQQKDGGWTYNRAPSDTMLTGTVLMGLTAARGAGIVVPAELIDKSVAFLKKYSAPGAYVAYKGRPVKKRSRKEIRDSAGRSILLELSLIQAGAGSTEHLERAVHTFFRYRERFDKIRDLEKGCHQKPYGIGTFYIFYGYFYLAHALEELGGDVRKQYRPILVNHFLKLQKKDGHWIDSKDHTGESYGTAMGLLILSAPVWAKQKKG